MVVTVVVQVIIVFSGFHGFCPGCHGFCLSRLSRFFPGCYGFSRLKRFFQDAAVFVQIVTVFSGFHGFCPGCHSILCPGCHSFCQRCHSFCPGYQSFCPDCHSFCQRCPQLHENGKHFLRKIELKKCFCYCFIPDEKSQQSLIENKVVGQLKIQFQEIRQISKSHLLLF